MAEENFEQEILEQHDVVNVIEEKHDVLHEVKEEQHDVLNDVKEEEDNVLNDVKEEEDNVLNDVKEEEDNVPKDLYPSDLHPSDDLPTSEEVHEPEHDLVVPEDKKWPGWPGENVFRMLVPSRKVGGIIGRKGEFIKKICEETRARIKFLDGPPGTTERAVMVSAKEEPDLDIPPAIEGLLRIHNRIVDADSDPANAQSGKMVSTRLLVAATQAGSLIGKQGATIKSIQDSSGCTIRVLGGENLPVFALSDDSVVEIQGEPAGLHKAVELIATHLRKFLVDRSVVGVFEMQMQMPNARANQNIPPPQSWGPPPQGFPMNAGGGPGYGPPPQYMPPQRHQFDNYYPPTDLPSEKQPRQGPPSYSRDVSAGSHTTSLPPQQSIVTKVSQNMQIPLSYADAVIGTSGANISYIRRSSGATIAVREGVPGEMTIEINGSASQVQAAQQLIQNFVADAASAQNSAGGPPGQSYNPYAHGPVYASPQSNTAGHGSHAPPGDYNSIYGSSYGGY